MSNKTVDDFRLVKVFSLLHRQCAVFLMDTQGNEADKESTLQDPHIFALSAWLGSYQIINVNRRIDWGEVDSKAGYCVHVQQNSKDIDPSKQPHSNLLLLVRDWPKVPTISHGLEGGNKYFEQKYAEASDEMKDLVTIYKKVSCFILPHPGLQTSEEGCHQWSVVRDECRKSITNLFEQLFSESTLQGLAECSLTGSDMLALIEKLKNQNNLSTTEPAISGQFQSYKDIYMDRKMERCVESYEEKMKTQIVENENISQLQQRHERIHEIVKEEFKEEKLIITDEYMNEFCNRLETAFEIILGKRLIQTYKNEWKKTYDKLSVPEKIAATFSQDAMRKTFTAIGEKHRKDLKRYITDAKVFQQTVNDYLNFLNDIYEEKDKDVKQNNKIALAVGGAFAGFVGCAALIAAPPLVALAAAVSIPTALAMAGGAATMGALGGAAGGSLGVGVSKAVKKDAKQIAESDIQASDQEN
uniref:Atlastin-2-like n=1 Tax=Phallusia mammillata TaxID=59560 RepID=A0A6F9D7X6_9ASCI|nr:atlastin-2-like [Phallusia mammillata]